jgi:CRISPR/Cas system-associated exonuclease Cas4 (RecB family)
LSYYLTARFGAKLMEKLSRKDYVRASALGEYVFCARAWWLRREGAEQTRGGEARAAGTRWHESHGRSVARAKRLRTVAAVCILLALALGLLLLYLEWPL